MRDVDPDVVQPEPKSRAAVIAAKSKEGVGAVDRLVGDVGNIWVSI
jgi:hypothetical protein